MSKYFDKDFFNFFFGFFAIIFISLIIILAVKIYLSNQDVSPTPIVNVVTP